MPKPKQPESYETLGAGYLQGEDKLALIKQIAADIPKPTPSSGFLVTLQGEDCIVKFQCIDRLLDDRRRLDGLLEEAEKHTKDFVKLLKSEYKNRSGHTLKLKEDKSRRNYTVQKISLNGTYHFVYLQVFDLEK